ncbi:HpaII family restriction endonuclease [Porphyromonas circumdentaria]|uniref:Type II restriction enzyme n=1 Tax=Porphyromonas circumdentaria TaxID=29524 RepID=A0A1T4LPD6_9PORP|nr:HpaII family restriction endonuclease [Porphyromonas circumdentaria]MBB6275507.1 hypothetical protein [Porphyromonas circumdentaria]SJZ56324.1 type II restriction enzyme [Porphyromonas circumdentaria]
MGFSGNKGEWSEFYAFLKLLSEGVIFSADGRLNRYEDRCYPILEVFRDDAPNRTSYKIQREDDSILITGAEASVTVPQEVFRSQAGLLLEGIKAMSGTAEFPHLHPFMDLIHNTTVKAKSSDKADIRIVIHNLHTGAKPELGYSIKSRLGAASTLINANKDGTNFIFKIDGFNEEQKNNCNALPNFRRKFDYLHSVGARISFQGVANETLHNNLMLLDLGIEKIIAISLLEYYSGAGRTLEEICDTISRKDPLGIMPPSGQPMYTYKIKQWLLAFALGMTSSSPWYGRFHANGGYIVVKEDGEIICYHFFDRNDLEDYLFFNTRFETPSTSRHDFGYIYEQYGNFLLKLNLQVRFK